jgi:hypothetical protein
VSASAGNSFWQYGESKSCYYDSATGQYVWRITQWGKRFVPQAIELVDWDTGEALGSTNSTSLSFQVGRNTIVRFKYVKAESWSRTWIIVPPPPPPPLPSQCDEILNDPNRGPPDREWCSCLRMVDYDRYVKSGCIRCRAYFSGSVKPCCVGADSATGCLNSWSGGAGSAYHEYDCNNPTTATLIIDWSASWSLKPGWEYYDWGQVQREGVVCRGPPSGSRGLSSASGTCTATVPPDRHVDIIIVFKQTS